VGRSPPYLSVWSAPSGSSKASARGRSPMPERARPAGLPRHCSSTHSSITRTLLFGYPMRSSFGRSASARANRASAISSAPLSDPISNSRRLMATCSPWAPARDSACVESCGLRLGHPKNLVPYRGEKSDANGKIFFAPWSATVKRSAPNVSQTKRSSHAYCCRCDGGIGARYSGSLREKLRALSRDRSVAPKNGSIR